LSHELTIDFLLLLLLLLLLLIIALVCVLHRCRRVFYAFDYEMSINGGGDAGAADSCCVVQCTRC
jgi:hypothetical protein